MRCTAAEQQLRPNRLEREQRTERRRRRRGVELARRRQFRGRFDHPSDDHRQRQGDQAGGCPARRKQTIKADLTGRPQHRGDMPMRQAAQYRQPASAAVGTSSRSSRRIRSILAGGQCDRLAKVRLLTLPFSR